MKTAHRMADRSNPRRWWVLLVAMVALLGLGSSRAQVVQPAGVGPQKLIITILDGDEALNNIRQRDAREPIVQVTDENHKPVAGALILFAIHDGADGAGATFAGGATSLSVTTGPDGIAHAVGILTHGPGKYTITVGASLGTVVAAEAVITQTNVLAAADAAASSSSASSATTGTTSASTGSTSAGTSAGTTGGTTSAGTTSAGSGATGATTTGTSAAGTTGTGTTAAGTTGATGAGTTGAGAGSAGTAGAGTTSAGAASAGTTGGAATGVSSSAAGTGANATAATSTGSTSAGANAAGNTSIKRISKFHRFLQSTPGKILVGGVTIATVSAVVVVVTTNNSTSITLGSSSVTHP